MSAAPSLFFGPADLPALRERLKDPELAPVWQGILAKAEGMCNPQSKTYLDPEHPFADRARGEYEPEGRHAALLVHSVGRKLSDCAETVGFAYQITGRKDLGQHGAAFVCAIAKEYPSTRPEIAKGFAGGRGDVMHGLALGYDWLGDAMTEAQRQEVAAVAKGYLEQFGEEFENPKNWWYKVHNYNGVNGGAAGCLALALHDAYPNEYQAWVDHAVAIIERWLDTGFDKEGSYFEGVGYSGYGLGNTVLFADALRRAKSKHDLFQQPLFSHYSTYLTLSLLPGERVYDARNDSNYSGLGGMLLGLAKNLDSGLYRWLWDNSGGDKTFQRIIFANQVVPVDPVKAGVPLADYFQGRGLCIWRTGWTAEDVMFSIEAGPYYATTHNQADKGHFTLYGLGQRWATDTGYANENSPHGRGQAAAHSCVLIEGKGQARSGAGLGTNGTIVSFTNNSRYGYALADCTEAYQKNNRGQAGAGVEFARRHALFVYPKGKAPAYAVVLDDIKQNGESHDFTWQMMLDDQMEATIRDDQAILARPEASGGGYVDSPWTSSDDAVASVAPGAQPPGELQVKVQVPKAGTYTLWARVRTLADEPSKADSFFVRMDDGQKIDWHMPAAASWTWGKVNSGVAHEPMTYQLAAGTHRLMIGRREPGAQVDCVALTTDAEHPPVLSEVRGQPLFAEAESGTASAPMRVVRMAETPTRLLVRIAAAEPVTLKTDICHTEDYHGLGAFPLLRADTQAVNPRFAAVLLPLPAETPTPKVGFANTPAGREIHVRWPDHEDVLLWPDQPDQPPTLR